MASGPCRALSEGKLRTEAVVKRVSGCLQYYWERCERLQREGRASA
jgi:hypothetical protein